MFKSLPLTVRTIEATEAILERIYDAAYLGLKEDSLAFDDEPAQSTSIGMGILWSGGLEK